VQSLVIYIVHSVLTINDTIPEIPSEFLPLTTVLPEQSEITQAYIPFQEYIPVACFCNQPTCNANVRSIQLPIIGLLTREGKIVKSLNIKIDEGKLMYIILLDPKSSVGDNTYLERISYWHLADSQHKLLAGASFDFAIRRQVSVTELRESTQRFSIGFDVMQTVLASLETTTGLSILTREETESITLYHYSASEFSQVVGIYQLLHRLAVRPSGPLLDYVANQTTGARCSSYIVFTRECGFLQLLPPFLQRTSTFNQVTVTVTIATTTMPTNTISDVTQYMLTTPGYSIKPKRIRWIIPLLLCVFIILLAGFITGIWYYLKCRRTRIRMQPTPTYVSLQHSDDY
jgi:hypothetical protein